MTEAEGTSLVIQNPVLLGNSLYLFVTRFGGLMDLWLIIKSEIMKTAVMEPPCSLAKNCEPG